MKDKNCYTCNTKYETTLDGICKIKDREMKGEIFICLKCKGILTGEMDQIEYNGINASSRLGEF